NDMNFWGLGAYLAWHQGNFGLLLDTALTFADNELEQSLPASMGMDKLKADVRARVYQAGAHAEYTIETEHVDITPHVGVRYMNVDVHNYDVKSGETVMYADDSSANIWTFPVGVTLSADFFTEGGWQVSPQLDVSVIPAAGDTSEHSNVSFVGLPGVYGLESEMLDEFSVRGSAGLELARDNLSLGLNYTLQAGEHVTSHNVMGVISYSF
ncbi:MAG: autotransporter outer membrane beta-barrel domain-containing protein, partial [Desulfovibrionaceae bacterium]|nr:autotransporter outer membrane beta-barrel domain-containing protein [Desulfovibrionaceae bacterium]